MSKKSPTTLKTILDEQLLDAVSRLKRVIGAADHLGHPDHCKDKIMHIYVTDGDSVAILNSLFHQFIHGDKLVSYQKPDGKPNLVPLNDAFKREDGAFEAEVFVPPAVRKKFLERLNNYIDLFTSPTSRKGFTR